MTSANERHSRLKGLTGPKFNPEKKGKDRTEKEVRERGWRRVGYPSLLSP